jgi:signal transduction histidine kinase
MQGMLYVGNIQPLSAYELNLVKSLAESFSVAYARYEDFSKLEKAKRSIEATLAELKSTQSQLIQAEKMASLGELTAGIAHEIQNPLNFVNNFSEVNKEMIAEMKEQINKGNYEEAKLIAHDLEDNEEKISYHGKRADAIIKGMLQHSRKNTGQKESTDINALAEEYVRLSYHGMRARNKNFSAEFKTDFDKNIGKINVVPQDIGRVLLNLFNNAFYAVNEKIRTADENYKPIVFVRTKKLKNKIEIKVGDNGNGIPQNIVDKIFQPFFTTKSTGEGTGLGLSLSYDIIKAHGGEIKVKTEEDEGAEFIIILNA